MLQLRNYQINISNKATDIIKQFGWCYLNIEPRCGKSLTSLQTATNLGCRNVLFLTKKKAITSVLNDYHLLAPKYTIQVTNYEQAPKISGYFDLLILDEAQNCFIGNTLIDGVKIKDIKLGSFQKCFNFVKNIYEYKKVLNVFKNELNENLVKIKCNGKEIVCTESHKIFTKRGWIRAGELLPTDELQIL